MKRLLLFLVIAVLNFNCYSQISFEKGYYIDNNNKRINCLIKNIDWKNNPTEFKYKLSENDKPKKATIKSVKEFGIENISKYIRRTINIDRSSEILYKLTEERNPIFKKEQLFIQVLVEGKGNLYLYEEENLKKYFYNKEDSIIEQLIYIRYLNANSSTVGENNQFKQQLWNNLNCSTIKMNSIKNLAYKKNSLINFFSKYNKCSNSNYINYQERLKRDLFNLTLRPRLSNSPLVIQNTLGNDFGNKLVFGLGIEAEFILPFNKNKWAITIEPTYHKFKAEKRTDLNNVPGVKLITKVNYSSFELPISLRHYFFLNKNSKIFLNTSFIFDLSSKSLIEFNRDDGISLNSLEIKARNSLSVGIGYKQNNRYSLEIRYQPNIEVLENFSFFSSANKTVSIIFGYLIF